MQAATELLGRVLPGAASQITMELLPQQVCRPPIIDQTHSCSHCGLAAPPTQADGAAAMQLDSHAGKVVLRGTGGVEMASALNWYMNDYLNITYLVRQMILLNTDQFCIEYLYWF